MASPFQFSQPVRTHFGAGILSDALMSELPKYGSKVMLCYGCGSVIRSGLYDKVHSLLDSCGKTVVDFGGIMPNPTYAKVLEGAQVAKAEKVDFILAVGGGSVSDCAKIIATQALSDEDIWAMETVHGRFPSVAIPLGVVVTASGTGSEQNSDAVITNEECHVKCDLYGLLPEFSILDPTLTLSVPMKQVLSGAFDSLSHAMETYFGKPDATFISDELNEAVMRNIIRNMRAAMTDPADVEARGELMWASALAENGILKLGKTTDFQCHMIEHQLGAYTDCSHGQGLAVLHPVMYRHLLWDNSAKFARFAQAVWGLDVASVSAGVEDVGAVSDDTEIEISLAEAGINALEEFIKECGLPLTFSEMGITLDEETINAIAESTMIRPGCARQFSPDEIADILRSCE